jgi:hypothetical protein
VPDLVGQFPELVGSVGGRGRRILTTALAVRTCRQRVPGCEMALQDEHQRSHTLAPRRLVLLLAALVIAVLLATFLFWLPNRGPAAAGKELRLEGIGSYGWYGSKDVGERFTDGLNHITVTSEAEGPIRLVSAKPLMDDGPTLRVLGVLARVVPDMLPAQRETGWFQDEPGFPPTSPDATGGVAVTGLTVRPPSVGENLQIEIQIGYEVVAEGRSTRSGVELIYEYGGETRRAVIPSHLAICAPTGVDCPPSDGG